MTLSNKMYDRLKWIAQILLPAMAAAYFALAGIWHLPYGEQVIGTLAVLDTFLGALLGLSTKQYQATGSDGVMQIDSTDPNKDVVMFKFKSDDISVFPNGSKITFTVEKKTAPNA